MYIYINAKYFNSNNIPHMLFINTTPYYNDYMSMYVNFFY